MQQRAADGDGERLPPRGGLAQGEGGDDGLAVAGAGGVQHAIKETKTAEGEPKRGGVAVLAQDAQAGGKVALPAVLQALGGKA